MLLALEYVASFLGLGFLLIFIHEFGHWYAARTIGVHATHFAIGWGRVLASRRDRNGCLWELRLIPVGGFVRFLGDTDEASVRASDGLVDATRRLPDGERRRYFALRSPLDKAFVIAAGPAVNLLFGFALVSAIYFAHGRPFADPVVASVEAGSAADVAGVVPGDVILSVNGQGVTRFEDVIDAVAMHPGSIVPMVVRTGAAAARTVNLYAKPVLAHRFGVATTAGQVGIASGPVDLRRVGPFRAMADGASDVWKMSAATVEGVWQVISGRQGLDRMGGPVKMAEMSGNAVRQGFLVSLVWMAVLSVNLGVVNLLPLPVLDGGSLAICAVEWVTRRRAPEGFLVWLNNFGAVFLFALFAIVTMNDVIGVVGEILAQ